MEEPGADNRATRETLKSPASIAGAALSQGSDGLAVDRSGPDSAAAKYFWSGQGVSALHLCLPAHSV